MKKLLFCSIFVSLAAFTLSSCDKPSDSPYPYAEHEVVYMGSGEGLTASSSDEEFQTALSQVMQEYADENPGSPEITINGVKYQITASDEPTGEVTDRVWGLFWDDVYEYSRSADTGSCWRFVYVHIPGKEAMVVYTIVKSENSVSYQIVRGKATPK